MSAIARTEALLEALMDKNVPSPLCVKITEGFLSTLGTDMTDMDDEAKADFFLTEIKTTIKNYNMSAAISKAQRDNHGAEQAAVASAKKDFS